MNRLDIGLRVRANTRDFLNITFREEDVTTYINEGIDRCKQVIPELREMVYLKKPEHSPALLPESYHHLLAIYSSARLFQQDERHFQAGNLMNEFEAKLQLLKSEIESCNLEIIDPETGLPVEFGYKEEYVRDIYFRGRGGI